MSAVSTFVLSAGYVLGAVWELARYAVKSGWVLLMPKAVLGARLTALLVRTGGWPGALTVRQ